MATPPAHPSLSSAPGSGRPLRRPGGSRIGLLHVSVVILVLSLVAAVVVPALQAISVKSRGRAVTRDLRAFLAAFQTYAREKGDWPDAEAVPGKYPPGMKPLLEKSNWTKSTPIGGRYLWAPNSLHQGERHRAAIVLISTPASPVSVDRQQLREIDRLIDDGDLDRGTFRLGYRNFPVFVIEH